MCDVQDLASDIPTSLYNLLMEMREKYEEFERNIKVQNLILQNDHLEEWSNARSFPSLYPYICYSPIKQSAVFWAKNLSGALISALL